MGRWYVNPETGDRVPSVTTIVGTMGKPALARWAAGRAAEYAIAHPAATVEEIKRAPFDESEERASIGTQVHAAVVGGKWARHLAPYAAAYRRICREHTLEPYVQEHTVWNRSYLYAGTADWVGWVDGELTLVDWKTSRSVWPETRLQLAGYRWSDDFAKWPIQRCMVGWLRPDGGVLLEQKVGEAEWDQFVRLRLGMAWR